MPQTPRNETRTTLRKRLRAQRRALSHKQQQLAAKEFAQQLRLTNATPLKRLQSAKHIAAYIPIDGELNPLAAIHALQQRGKHLYLPLLGRRKINGRMLFGRFTDTSQLRRGRFNTREPALSSRRMPPWALDIVLLPLVGFDASGQRLGMGGGFYDRCFANNRKQRSPRWPLLVGIAHDCQECDALKTEHWDVAVDVVLTPGRVIDCSGKKGV